MPAHDGADYLDTVPGFATIRKGGSGADPVFRGMAGSRVSILVDDAALLGGCSSRMDAPTAYIFPETFDRITIVKGPQTVKHGAPASAATVLFERTRTRLDAPSWQGNASVLGGSWGRNDQVADIRAGTPAFYVRGAGSRSAMDDYTGGDGTTVHSQYLRWNADAAVGWTPDAQTLLELSVTGSDGRAAYADRGVDGSKFLRRGTSVRLERTRNGSALHRVDVTGAYNYVHHIMDNHTLRAFVPSAMSPTPSSMNPDRTTYGGRLATRWLGQRATWDIGTDVQVNEHTNRMSMNQPTMHRRRVRRNERPDASRHVDRRRPAPRSRARYRSARYGRPDHDAARGEPDDPGASQRCADEWVRACRAARAHVAPDGVRGSGTSRALPRLLGADGA
jgi:iron complex outermembrane receptor protein